MNMKEGRREHVCVYLVANFHQRGDGRRKYFGGNILYLQSLNRGKPLKLLPVMRF